MQIVDRYVFRQILVATFFIVVVLAVLVFLTQSLRYLELVMDAGASGMAFWAITALALPSFLEVILPIGTVAAVLFIYNRLVLDSELVVLKALGFSPLRLARPAIVMAVMMGIFLFVVMGWVAPVSKSSSIEMRKDIKARLSTLIFRDGVFTEAGKGLMVYIRDRDKDGNLLGLVIHDARETEKSPSTIIAARGVLVSTKTGHQVLVYDGSRQQYDPQSGIMQRLDFDRYTVDMPEEKKTVSFRWQEPDERVLGNLFSSLEIENKKSERRALRLEIYKRILTPMFVFSLVMMALVALLLGRHDRRGQGKRILAAVVAVVVAEVLFLLSYNFAKGSPVGYGFMMLVVLLPMLGGFFLLIKDRVLIGILRQNAEKIGG